MGRVRRRLARGQLRPTLRGIVRGTGQRRKIYNQGKRDIGEGHRSPGFMSYLGSKDRIGGGRKDIESDRIGEVG